MSDTVEVGLLSLPVAPSGTNTAIEDPTLIGLLDFLGFLIKDALDAKLTEQGGPVTSAAITDACPVGFRFPWDPQDNFMRPHNVGGAMVQPLPGLWAWEEGQLWSKEGSSLMVEAIEREIKVLYVFPQLATPDGMLARHGLMSAIGKTFARAAMIGLHHEYSYNGDPPGTPIWRSLNLVDFQYLKGAAGRLAQTPTAGAQQGGRGGAEGYVHRFYPAFTATFSVIEHVQPVSDDADTLQTDGTLTLAVDDGTSDPLDVLERTIISPHDQA